MASVKYQVFCRYINENVNKPLTNTTTMDWVDSETLKNMTKFYLDNKVAYEQILNDIKSGKKQKSNLTEEEEQIYVGCGEFVSLDSKIKNGKAVVDVCIIRPHDSMYNDTDGSKKRAASKLDQELYQALIEESSGNNPKYDMVFMYDGISLTTGEADKNPPPTDKKELPYLYYDKFKRVKLDPWFLYSTHASLNSAMHKVRELVNILGKNSVKIGKEVALEQYIDIV